MQATKTIYISKKSRTIINDCFHCGGKITSKDARAETKYCSSKCCGLSQRKTKIINCLHCNKEFKQKDKKQKFCNKSCSCSYNNERRIPPTEEQKQKTSETLKRKYANGGVLFYKKECKVHFKRCDNCNKLFVKGNKKGNMNSKNCSRECSIISITKKQKTLTKYFNPYENKLVSLDSTWEIAIADFLCDNDIEWIRPQHIYWYDSTGKKRLYFPDFYLPEVNLYLDPKNPSRIKQDGEKLYIVCKMVNLVYGDVEYIKNCVLNMVGDRGFEPLNNCV